MVALRRAALALAICLAFPLVSVEPAFAARTLTVTPSTGLREGQVVEVTAVGFTPMVDVRVCQSIMDATPSQSDCSMFSGSAAVRSDESGAISAQFDVRQSIYVPSLDRAVDCVVEACFIRAGEIRPGAPEDIEGTTAFSTRLLFLRVQPDCLLQRLSDGQFFGDNVYNDEVSQTWSHGTTAGNGWSFALRVQNDGDATEDLIVRGLTEFSSPVIRVRYFAGWLNVTSYVTGGGFTFGDVPPGGIRKLVVQFRAAAAASLGARSRQAVRCQWAAPNGPVEVEDEVHVGVRVVAPT
ncbi:MAG: Neocarzinostatin family [Actinomycetota bacterium]|nr:Neocarzinostatin family [Actinomycetota bacterium]